MIRGFGAAFAAVLLFCPFVPAHAAEERGLMIRADKLMAQPFIDAANGGAVTANQPVTILGRRGGWANVESKGKKGWVRLLNVRLEPRAGVAGTGKPSKSTKSPLSLLQTNSSSQTVTTGIKGMDEEDIRKARVNYAEVDRLNALGITAAQGRSYGERNRLKERKLDYLKKGGSR